jgi:hypothetical protein
MGLFNFLFNTETVAESTTDFDTTPAVNCDGTPMIPGSFIDAEGKPFGVCDDHTFDTSIDDTLNHGFDDSFSSFDDSSSSFDDW